MNFLNKMAHLFFLKIEALRSESVKTMFLKRILEWNANNLSVKHNSSEKCRVKQGISSYCHRNAVLFTKYKLIGLIYIMCKIVHLMCIQESCTLYVYICGTCVLKYEVNLLDVMQLDLYVSELQIHCQMQALVSLACLY